MQLNNEQILYLKDVLGIESLLMPENLSLTAIEEGEVKTTEKVVDRLVIAPSKLDREQEALLEKITKAFGWDDYHLQYINDKLVYSHAKVAFVFGASAKDFAKSYMQIAKPIYSSDFEELIKNPSLKKDLWSKMQSLMES